jgi:DNA-binding beta-propeller fold protein YncE
VVTSGAQGFSGAGVTMYDAGTLAPLATWTTGAGIAFADIDAGAGLLYVSHWIARRVFVLRTSDLTQVAEIGDPTFSGALGVAVDPGLDRIYVARTYRSAEPNVEALTVIDRRPDGKHAIGRTIPLGKTVQPWQVAVDPVLGHVYVIGLGGGGVHPQLIVFDRATMAEKLRINTISGFTHSRNIAARPGTGIVHVTSDAGIQVIDVNQPAVVGFVPQPQVRSIVASGPEQVTSMSLHDEVARLRPPPRSPPPTGGDAGLSGGWWG